ncbi:glycosyltransferase [Acidimicrobiaceae bacterium USS-CC1]|uniref:Glycosyltransferase n=1 Tax=Acidiferrimicrobium australe TaxID=2664430 RepID=A0ABW9QSU5_9ACTN|nr:glycosyltransferase [Acidiferrimicrobium australe]
MKSSNATPWVLGTTATVSASNFVFLVMVARTFSPDAFGAFAAIAALLLLYEVPASAVQALVAGATARRGRTLGRGGCDRGAGLLAVDCLLAGSAACVVVTLATPLLDSVLHLHGAGATVLLGVDALPVAIALVPKGILFGLGRLRPLAAALAAGAVTKLAVGVVLVHGGDGLDGAVAALVAGELVTASVLLFATRRELRSPTVEAALPESPRTLGLEGAGWGRGIGAAFASTGYWLLAGADLLVARHWLQPGQSGVYAAAATAAQLAMWVPVTVASSVMGSLVPWPGCRWKPKRRTAMVGAVLAGALLSAGIALAARPLLVAMFDSSYRGGSAVAGILALATALFGITTVAVAPMLARRRGIATWLPWVGAVAFLTVTALFHSSPLQIAWATLSVNGGVVAALVVVGVLSGARARMAAGAADQQNLAAEAELELTVVMPYYNPGDLLAHNLTATLEALAQTEATFEVIAVSDGSTDGSEQSIAHIGDPHLRRVVLPANQGKGAAVAAGLILGRGRYLGFIDADGDLDPSLLATFVTLMRLHQPDVVLGCKRHPLSLVDYPRLRTVYSRGYQLLIRAMFRLDLRDTQTGLKLIRRDVLAAALPRMLEKRFAWDLELLVVARRLGYRRFLEAPIVLRHQFTSTVSWKAVWRTFTDTLGIFYRLYALRWYDREHREISVRAGGGAAPVAVLRLGTGPSAVAWSSPRWARSVEGEPA